MLNTYIHVTTPNKLDFLSGFYCSTVSVRLTTPSREALALHARVSGARDKIPSVCLKIGQMWRKAPCFGLPLRYASNTQSPTIFRSIFLYMVEST